MVDWSAGRYETTAAELAPAADVVIEAAGLHAGEAVIDIACGTGNGALAAARRGAHVVGIDGATRLLAVAAHRAGVDGLELDLREGDLLALPAENAGADVVVSVFGVIFAIDPLVALREVRRVLSPSGRVLITAWIPAGPIHQMLGVMGQVVARASNSPAGAGPRFAWNDVDVFGSVAAEAGLMLRRTTAHQLSIRAASVADYVDASWDHPMGVAALPLLRGVGAEDELRTAQLRMLDEANEEPDAFLVHNPYVVHELTAAPS